MMLGLPTHPEFNWMLHFAAFLQAWPQSLLRCNLGLEFAGMVQYGVPPPLTNCKKRSCALKLVA